MIEGRPARGRTFFYLSLICTIYSFLIFSCGLDTVSFLTTPPINAVQFSSRAASFSPPPFPDPSYDGIDYFYRIYSIQADAELDKAKFETLQNNSSSVIGDVIETVLLNTGSNGLSYKRIGIFKNLSISTASPILNEIDTIDPEIVELAFATNELQRLDSSATVLNNFYRNTYSGLRLFSSGAPSIEDDDLEYNEADDNMNQFYIQVYVASYGLDFSIIKALYSKAVFLGVFEIVYD